MPRPPRLSPEIMRVLGKTYDFDPQYAPDRNIPLEFVKQLILLDEALTPVPAEMVRH